MKKISLLNLRDVEASVGERVELSGVLAISRKSAYLISSAEEPDAEARIEVVAPNLEKSLDATIGGWMGGKFSYLDQVTIQGELRGPTTKSGAPTLINVVSIFLERDGMSHRVLL